MPNAVGSLITFGCSWVKGVGTCYTPGMTADDYNKCVWDEKFSEVNSFRIHISNKLHLFNINFAEAKSSNQRQFRYAKQFFTSDQFNSLRAEKKPIYVLWGITSTARNELYSLKDNDLYNFTYTGGHELAKMMVQLSYDHTNEVNQLGIEMRFWNIFFESIEVKNIWVDLFNHHNYINPVKNLVGYDENPRDLLSYLAKRSGVVTEDTRYHTSTWRNDSDRLNRLTHSGIINPYSFHPTAGSHLALADYLVGKLI
jgi:hypothetical protein